MIAWEVSYHTSWWENKQQNFALYNISGYHYLISSKVVPYAFRHVTGTLRAHQRTHPFVSPREAFDIKLHCTYLVYYKGWMFIFKCAMLCEDIRSAVEIYCCTVSHNMDTYVHTYVYALIRNGVSAESKLSLYVLSRYKNRSKILNGSDIWGAVYILFINIVCRRLLMTSSNMLVCS